MSQILNKVRNVDPNNNDAVKEVLTSFFQNIVNHKEVNCNKWLRTLENVLNRFPKYCSPQRASIETYLTNFLGCNNYQDVIEVAKCSHALQQVQWPQNKTATVKSAWRDQMELLCNSAHSLIDVLFIDSVDMYKRGSKMIQTQPNSTSPLTAALTRISFTGSTASTNKLALLQTRLRNTFIFIQAMIIEIYPVAKPIRPQTILGVIIRTLSVTSGKKPQSTDVSSVKIQALRTLDALIACLGANLIPFSPLILRIAMQTLRWSSENPNEGSRQVRSCTYNSLGNWLTTLHSHRLTTENTWEDELSSHIIGDTTPLKKTVELTMSGQSLKNLSKKAKRKLQNTMLQESTIASHMPGEKNKLAVKEETNNDVASSALECAEVFFSVCGVFLKPTTHKIFQEHFVRECYNASTYSDEYLLLLLRVLEASRKTTPPTIPPPTQYCLHLYSLFSNNQCKEIAKFCLQALLDIRLHLHCSPPSLNFSLEVHQEELTTRDKQNKISERNIAALEKLLGLERMPLIINEEIINIPDEPVNKKPRLEEVLDKISLSSESVCSVEITGDNNVDEINNTSKELESEIDIIQETIPDFEKFNKNTGNNEEPTNSQEHTDTLNVEVEDDVNENEILRPEPVITENTEESAKNKPENTTMDEEATQVVPLNTSRVEVNEEEKPPSMEVAYDYPNMENDKVTVLEKMDDDNLPSTNDTDDNQITSEQADLISQEIETDNKLPDNIDNKEIESNVIAKENGLEATNGDIHELETQLKTAEKLTKTDGVSVEDMMADFVDEFNEQTMDA